MSDRRPARAAGRDPEPDAVHRRRAGAAHQPGRDRRRPTEHAEGLRAAGRGVRAAGDRRTRTGSCASTARAPSARCSTRASRRPDVGDRILLAGVTREFEQELANASVYAMSSRYEGLPMVLLEALSKGVPPVSFDCPEGPRQLIRSGTNGLLVPQGDIDRLTEALRSADGRRGPAPRGSAPRASRPPGLRGRRRGRPLGRAGRGDRRPSAPRLLAASCACPGRRGAPSARAPRAPAPAAAASSTSSGRDAVGAVRRRQVVERADDRVADLAQQRRPSRSRCRRSRPR